MATLAKCSHCFLPWMTSPLLCWTWSSSSTAPWMWGCSSWLLPRLWTWGFSYWHKWKFNQRRKEWESWYQLSLQWTLIRIFFTCSWFSNFIFSIIYRKLLRFLGLLHRNCGLADEEWFMELHFKHCHRSLYHRCSKEQALKAMHGHK